MTEDFLEPLIFQWSAEDYAVSCILRDWLSESLPDVVTP